MRVSTNQFQQISLNAILDQQSKLSRVQEQVATGRRILSPSDDPAGAARSLELAKSIESIESFQRNIGFAESRLSLEETSLTEVGNLLQRVRELTLQAANGSQTAEDRRLIGAEVRERFDQLLELSNTTDGNGEFLFAGLKSRDQPFVRTVNQVSYVGDQQERQTQVGPNRKMETTHSGFDVFMKIPNGNGNHVTTADSNNTGSGVIAGAEIVDATATTGNEPYTITFDQDANGDTIYDVTDTNGNLVIDDGAFDELQAITFEGLSVEIKGEPAVGDTFTVDQSSRQSMFETVDRLASALENASPATAERAQFQSLANRTLQELDQSLENVLDIRAEIGARLSGLEDEKNANGAAILELTTTKSGITDLDYAEAITKLNSRLTGLQAAQQSYTQIQGLSLFNFL